jgi:hypothetical protein
MITNVGKNILAKYLIGQTTSYASHIAIGCGAEPLNIGDSFEDYSDKKNLDFEMFRIPITSRGFVNVDNVPYVVFTAELPSTERYEISEVGIFSAGANPSAGRFDSKTLLEFTADELWEYHGPAEAVAIPSIESRLDSQQDNVIDVPSESFQAAAENITFSEYLDRVNRKERARFLSNSVFVKGDEANIIAEIPIIDASGDGQRVTYITQFDHQLIVGEKVTISGVVPSEFNVVDATVESVDRGSNSFTIISDNQEAFVSEGILRPNHLTIQSGNHIHLTGVNFNLDNNAAGDELRLAFSIVNKEGAPKNLPENAVSNPSKVRIVVEFSSSEEETSQFARFEVDLEDSDLQDGRYFVVSRKLEELYKTPNFAWDSATIVKIFPSIFDVGGSPSPDFYLCLDAMRLENLTTLNPLYGLTGYSVIKNQDGKTIIKQPNSSNFVEFRFAFDIDLPEGES